MDLSPGQLGQLIAGLLMVVLLISSVLAMPSRVTIAILLVLIPFQPIETQYGSANVLLSYALFGALMLSGKRLRMPFLVYLVAVVLAYLTSMSQAHESTYVQHGIYIFLLVSSFSVFYLAYNFVRELDDVRYAINVLIISNIIVLIVCALQVGTGITDRLTFFGIEELRLHRVRADDRVVGPFGAAGLTAEYLMLMIFILGYDLLHAIGRRRMFVLALIAANMGVLLSTANRGALLTMMAMFPLFLYSFRQELGTIRAVRIGIAASVLFVAMSVVVVNYTDYGRMFERLTTLTETEGFIPSTRQITWPVAWENIKDRPFLGHGPRLRLLDDDEVAYEGHVVIPYPHSLYLFLLFTVGVVGATAVLAFIARLGWDLLLAARATSSFTYESGLVKLGPLLLLAILVDQIKVEFLRVGYVDYSHFLFCLLGLMLGFAHRELARHPTADQSSLASESASESASEEVALGYSREIPASQESLSSISAHSTR